MGVIPNPKMAFIFPISCILALIFPILIKYFPKCVGKGSFPKSQIKSLRLTDRPDMIIAVDWNIKHQTNQTNKEATPFVIFKHVLHVKKLTWTL